ncbi:MAG TPA: NUDIX domain-containing protein [Natronosporangium sp.]|nr:NUDIX domain-containing protein [Natronosporangium sp.]
MTGIRHFTASAIVFDQQGQVLLIHHHKLGMWLYPGGHIDPNEDPAQAVVREVREETGVAVELVSAGTPFTHPAVVTHPVPFAILELPVPHDPAVGPHHHIDLVYVCRAISRELTPRPGEIRDCRWVPVEEVATYHVPPHLPDLMAAAAAWVDSGAAVVR